ncbi:hypothetical protein CANMA_001439 [Candida margitis]|uniref:uncharacterized protein n=1 Tax=Candida margitis TaxID=1775924 RepID=UPI00222636EB|nr:uncharacterized protein CANMA_001439 [Candida margitis]KAI5969372.1 hypothetical protein CANMA_001439 [Candida margitis]
MTTLVFECCLRPWLALKGYEKKEGNHTYPVSLDGISFEEVLTVHLINYIRNCNQPMQIDKSLSTGYEAVESSLLYEDDKEGPMISSEQFSQIYFERRCDKVSIPISKALVNGCLMNLVLSQQFKEHRASILHKSLPLVSEVEHILKSKFAVTSIFATTQKMLTPNSPANKLIDEMRKRRAISDTITIEQSTKFQFNFYSVPTQVERVYNSTNPRLDLSVDDITQQFEDASFIGIPKPESGRNVLIESEPTLQVFEEVNALSEEIMSSTNLAFTIFKLPHEDLLLSWETIILGAKFKRSILNCCKTMLNSTKLHLKTGNFVIFEGMPGTGKTSLAKAVFQKLSIAKQGIGRYEPSVMMEFSTGEIFSKYFGESPKKLSALLLFIEQLLLRHPTSIVFLLVDELETIATSRTSLMGNNEVSDGLRIVNILITYLDRLKVFPNLVIIATTNMLSSIDTAVLDRAVRIFKFGSPSFSEIEQVLRTNLDTINPDKGDLSESEISSSLQQLANFCHVRKRFSRLKSLALY